MKKVVIHTMVGKEDGERRRWKGKPGIKESLRAGSSVLTLSCSVDITDNSRRRPRQHRPTRGSFLFFFFLTTKKRREVSRKKTWLLVHVCPIFGFYCSILLSVDVCGGSQWLLTWHSFNPIRDRTRLCRWIYLHIITKFLQLISWFE